MNKLTKEKFIATTGCKKCLKKPIKSLQQKFKEKKFAYDNYWQLKYQLSYNKNNPGDAEYISVIKARSYNQALDILFAKIKEDEPLLSPLSVNGEMFYKNYRFTGRHNPELTIKDWEDIRNCAFPNENNFLFKLKIK